MSTDAPAVGRRDDVGEVRERGAEAPEQLAGARRTCARSGCAPGAGSTRCPPGRAPAWRVTAASRSRSASGASSREERRNVRLVSRAATAEHVGVDDDERLQPASSRYRSTCACTARSQVKSPPPGALRRAAHRRRPPPAALRDRVRVERVDLERDAVCELVVGPAGRGDDRRGAGHRLQHRQAETLVERDVGDCCGAAVEPGKLLVVDSGHPPNAVPVHAYVAPALGADDAELEPFEARSAKAFERAARGSSSARPSRRPGCSRPPRRARPP